MGHGAELQLKDPLLAHHSSGCRHWCTILIGQKEPIPLPTNSPKYSQILLAVLRKVGLCLSFFLYHGAHRYLNNRKHHQWLDSGLIVETSS